MPCLAVSVIFNILPIVGETLVAVTQLLARPYRVVAPHASQKSVGGHGCQRTCQWTATDGCPLCRRVIAHVKSIIEASPVKAANMRILLTGHSLGGVVAILAAHDLATQLGLRNAQVRAEFCSDVTTNWADEQAATRRSTMQIRRLARQKGLFQAASRCYTTQCPVLVMSMHHRAAALFCPMPKHMRR